MTREAMCKEFKERGDSVSDIPVFGMVCGEVCEFRYIEATHNKFVSTEYRYRNIPDELFYTREELLASLEPVVV